MRSCDVCGRPDWQIETDTFDVRWGDGERVVIDLCVDHQDDLLSLLGRGSRPRRRVKTDDLFVADPDEIPET